MEKIENYQLLQVIEKLRKLKKVVVVRIVIGGAFRAVSDMFEIYTGDLNPIQTGGGLFEPPLRQNRDNSYTERAMTFKFSDFS